MVAYFIPKVPLTDTLTLVSYNAPDSYFNYNDAFEQTIYQQKTVTGTFTAGQTYCVGPVTIPSGNYQIDFICGPAIDHFGPSGSNIFYHAQNRIFDSDNGGPATTPVGPGDFGTIGLWQNKNGKAIIDSFNGGPNSTELGDWLATNFPTLFGTPNAYDSATLSSFGKNTFDGLTNAQIAQVYSNLWSPSGVAKNTYVQAFAVALGTYADSTTLGGSSVTVSYGFKVLAAGQNLSFNVGSNGAAFGVANNTSITVLQALSKANSNFTPSSGLFYGGNSTYTTDVNNVLNGINTAGDVANAALSNATLGFSPAQIRDAYGINALSLDGTGQTIAIVGAYDNPSIFDAVDLYDAQFGATDAGPSLLSQYGASATFLSVLNQSGQSTGLPSVDPTGGWETETELDVEWVHAIAPGAKIDLVEANSQSLSDLMGAVATASNQPGVSVVSMSWGMPENYAVQAGDEAAYDQVLNKPGVSFVASTGDWGTADPEYPSFSPNVVAVGGTSLTLNADSSYNSETGWGYYSDSVGEFIGSGGGISSFEPEPTWQNGVQSSGYRSTPDVSIVADPATGAWIADPYNLSSSSPWEVVGGTSLSAPIWAGLLTLVNQGRANAGQPALNASNPTDAQQALYAASSGDFNQILSGTNGGYNAGAGYNMVTGLGSPVANLLVPDLIAHQSAADAPAGNPNWAGSDPLYANSGAGGSANAVKLPVSDALVLSRMSGQFVLTDLGFGGERHSIARSPSMFAPAFSGSLNGADSGIGMASQPQNAMIASNTLSAITSNVELMLNGIDLSGQAISVSAAGDDASLYVTQTLAVGAASTSQPLPAGLAEMPGLSQTGLTTFGFSEVPVDALGTGESYGFTALADSGSTTPAALQNIRAAAVMTDMPIISDDKPNDAGSTDHKLGAAILAVPFAAFMQGFRRRETGKKAKAARKNGRIAD